MDAASIDDTVSAATKGLRLLGHPFYRRWEAGELVDGELTTYAGQYRHFEAMLPAFLGTLASSLPEGEAHRAVTANLADECGDPVPHLELFDRFADALGAPVAAATPATKDLLAAYDTVLAQGPVPALAGLLAYERQAPEIAESKAAGLRAHYGLDAEAVSFWDHHATVDVAHGAWTADALADLDAPQEVVAAATRVVAEAWWAFLDEREAARPLA
jgi:pyrroloquinoline-quinone synthase